MNFYPFSNTKFKIFLTNYKENILKLFFYRIFSSPFFYGLVLIAAFNALNGCIPLPAPTNDQAKGKNIIKKAITTENHAYEKNIRSIFLCVEPISDDPSAKMRPAVQGIAQTSPLILEFDDLHPNPRNYRAKILHCQADWQLSNLNEIEYLNEVNDFPIRTHQLSFNTKVPYVHYTFSVPKVKLSGNYILLIQRDGEVENDYVLAKRFVIYEQKVNFQPQVRMSNVASNREKNQQISFKVDYTAMDIRNPLEDIKVVIRQNFREDNALRNLKPFQVKDFDKTLEYSNYLSGENEFAGNNEFRRFDMRSTRFLGFNMMKIMLDDSVSVALVNPDQTRGGAVYFRQPDVNGGFYVFHYETGRGKVESDYIKVRFFYKNAEKFSQEVYVIGNFNQFAYTDENKMTYSEEKGGYEGEILLKQGEYNYMFALKPNNGTPNHEPTEGSYQETENNYEIFVYYRPLGARNDQIIGYQSFNSTQVR